MCKLGELVAIQVAIPEPLLGPKAMHRLLEGLKTERTSCINRIHALAGRVRARLHARQRIAQHARDNPQVRAAAQLMGIGAVSRTSPDSVILETRSQEGKDQSFSCVRVLGSDLDTTVSLVSTVALAQIGASIAHTTRFVRDV
jgi:hypothetical protein